MDKNNQYGQEMTKSLPPGCIKEKKKAPSWKDFKILIEKVSIDDKIGHLFVADIFFDENKASKIKLMYSEIYTPLFKKKKVLDLSQRSVFQLLEANRKNKDENRLNSYKCNRETKTTKGKKILIPLYLEHIRFLVKRAGPTVTKIHSHYTFEQERFKKGFIIINQTSCHEAKNSVEKDFYKLLNNFNFGYDCWNKTGNCSFLQINNELEEIFWLEARPKYFW